MSEQKLGTFMFLKPSNDDGGVFGGEPCGAWVHPQMHLCPDGLLSAAMFLAALEEEGKSVSEFIGEVPEYITERVNIVCKNEQKYKLVEQLGGFLKLSSQHTPISPP